MKPDEHIGTPRADVDQLALDVVGDLLEIRLANQVKPQSH